MTRSTWIRSIIVAALGLVAALLVPSADRGCGLFELGTSITVNNGVFRRFQCAPATYIRFALIGGALAVGLLMIKRARDKAGTGASG